MCLNVVNYHSFVFEIIGTIRLWKCVWDSLFFFLVFKIANFPGPTAPACDWSVQNDQRNVGGKNKGTAIEMSWIYLCYRTNVIIIVFVIMIMK